MLLTVIITLYLPALNPLVGIDIDSRFFFQNWKVKSKNELIVKVVSKPGILKIELLSVISYSDTLISSYPKEANIEKFLEPVNLLGIAT